MELKTKNKTIVLVFTTRKIVNISNILKGKNFEDLYFSAMNEGDLNALSKIIFTFAEDKNGVKAFNSSEDVYEFIDDYKAENNKSYEEIFEDLAEVINKEGFFNKKMTQKDLKAKMSNPLSSVNMNDVIKNSAEKAIAKVAEEQFSKG